MSDSPMARWPAATRARLWAEFIGLYAVAPVIVAVLLPPGWMFPMLFLITAVGLCLLHVTEGFHWHELTRNSGAVDWRVVAAFALGTLAVSGAVILTTRPEAFLSLLLQRPAFLLLIVVLYPVLSALPQEILFRPLFFRRYGTLLPGLAPAILLNGVLFSLAHLMYWSWIVAGMTFVGGLIFAWAYEARRSFAMALVMHSVAGWIIFALGLGMFFYSGNVQRPF
ncbi:MAG: CPBP family intramembrane glutamic endopeptidase [Paracoccaceae bacterium]